MQPVRAFQATGIEIEYMIVDRRTFEVLPASDRLLHAVAGGYADEVEQGALCWSNELVLHVLELKTNGPAAALAPLPAAFTADVARIDALLEPLGGTLMPGAAHPWMDPDRDMRLWPHGYNAIYAHFNRIFDCRGHGWSNLQSMHVNLPFADDAEFGALHTAIRALLPIMPALSAASPLIGARATGLMDTRLEYYRGNARAIASITGLVVPEPVRSREEYARVILAPMYRDIAPHDPEGILQEEWLNSRGAIARFDRGAIEIRILDSQERATADLAIAAAVIGAVRMLYEQRWTDTAQQLRLPTEALAALLLESIRDAERAVLRDRALLATYGFPERSGTLGEIWQHLAESGAPTLGGADEPLRDALDVILRRGTLARRMLAACGPEPSPARLRALAAALCDCLRRDRPFLDLD
ncbi:MAG: glutamate-cysteine ligase family protein [Gammaproteobacteria bacterium]